MDNELVLRHLAIPMKMTFWTYDDRIEVIQRFTTGHVIPFTVTVDAGQTLWTALRAKGWREV